MPSASKQKAQLLVECEAWLVWEWEEQEAHWQLEEEEFVQEMAVLEVKEEAEWKVSEVDIRKTVDMTWSCKGMDLHNFVY